MIVVSVFMGSGLDGWQRGYRQGQGNNEGSSFLKLNSSKFTKSNLKSDAELLLDVNSVLISAACEELLQRNDSTDEKRLF